MTTQNTINRSTANENVGFKNINFYAAAYIFIWCTLVKQMKLLKYNYYCPKTGQGSSEISESGRNVLTVGKSLIVTLNTPLECGRG